MITTRRFVSILLAAAAGRGRRRRGPRGEDRRAARAAHPLATARRNLSHTQANVATAPRAAGAGWGGGRAARPPSPARARDRHRHQRDPSTPASAPF